ncbi:flavodoxin family protein [candidate division WS5 bacterium]|uniref:Flavodoxin family protein n=1 Tax=candidate division WS5 bacterium TaxID=2093353 RepID=A0A419DA57_9BACT|nr:MAG: flavodoxin family protein [candidate division WS5 bacterium]
MAKIIGISGSPRKENSYYMVETVLKATEKPFDLFHLKELSIEPCNGCMSCMENFKCQQKDDMEKIIQKIENSQIIVFGSPTYFSNVSGLMKNFMDRCCPFYFSQKLRGKKAIILSVGNLKEELEFDEKGNCKWHKEEIECVEGCQKAIERFCGLLGIEIIGSVYALHSEPEKKEKELIQLGQKIGDLVKC